MDLNLLRIGTITTAIGTTIRVMKIASINRHNIRLKIKTSNTSTVLSMFPQPSRAFIRARSDCCHGVALSITCDFRYALIVSRKVRSSGL